MNNYEKFLQAIYQKKLIQVKFDSKEKGIVQRLCIPFDFGPWRRNISNNHDRYHLYDLNSPEGKHNLSILPDQVISIENTDQGFDPANYIKWSSPYNWFIQRNWGLYS